MKVINSTALMLSACSLAIFASAAFASEFDCSSRTEIACKLEAIKSAEKANLREIRTVALTRKDADNSCLASNQAKLGLLHAQYYALKAKGAVLCKTGVVRDIEETGACDGKFVVEVSDCSEGK